VAAGTRTGAGDLQNLRGAQISRLAGARRMGKGAVMTDVAAELGQRDEDLARIRYQVAMRLVAQRRCNPHQRLQIRAVSERQRLGRRQTPPGLDA
jgi:hypothetical protein